MGSIKKLISDINMKEKSLIAERVIYDAINSANADAGNFPISKEIRPTCKKAHHRKQLVQESKKSDMQKSEKEQMRQLKKEELKELQRQKRDVEQTTETLKKTYSEKTIVPAQEN